MIKLPEVIKNLRHLKIEIKHQHQLWLTLDQPEKYNAISYEMIDSLEKTLTWADRETLIKVVVIRGEGEAFSSGGDVKEMNQKAGMFQGESYELMDNYRFGIQRIPRVMESFSKPLIALIHGAAVGAGFDLTLMCDIRFASEKAKFGETFINLGLISGDGGTYFLIRALGYAKAMELSLTGRMLKAEEALSYGLVHGLFSSHEIQDKVEKYAHDLCQKPTEALIMSKRLVKNVYLNSLQNNLELAASFQGIAQRQHAHEEAVQNLIQKMDRKK